MAAGFDKTFELLTKTLNEAAVDVLVRALDVPEKPVQLAALAAVLDRRNLVGELEVIRRWDQAREEWKRVIGQRRGHLGKAVRDALLSNDLRLANNACDAVAWLREYDQIPTLIQLLEDPRHPLAQSAAARLVDLAELLYQELSSPRDYKDKRDPQLVRRNVLGPLEQSVRRYSRHRRRETLEALLLLALRDNSTLKQVLLDPFHAAYGPMVELLLRSQRGGVLRLLLSFLDDAQPPAAAISALTRRVDHKFVRCLLRKVGHDPSPAGLQNLKRIDSVPWADPQRGELDRLDGEAQSCVVKLVVASGLQRPNALAIVTYLASHGTSGGRRAAAAALAEFHGPEASLAIWRALDDADPLVRAAAIGQLRHRNLPGTLPRLISLVDDRHRVVRDAARAQLPEFKFQRFVASFDMLDAESRAKTGLLVKKVDPAALDELREELSCGSRTRRLRALEITAVMQAGLEVESRVIDLLSDEDHLVRAEAARMLGDSDSPEVDAALSAAILDRTPMVMEAARRSLQVIANRRSVPAAAPEGSLAP